MKAAEIVKTIKSGALRIDIRRYRSGRFGFDWQNDGEREQVMKRDLKDAEAKARELIGATKAGRVELLGIDEDDYAEFLQWRAKRKASIEVPKVVALFLANKESKGIAAKTVRGLRHNLTLFSESFTGPIHLVKAVGVEGWIDGRNVGPRRWNNIRADIVSLFRYARRYEHLPDETTEVEKIEKKKVAVTVQTYTPDELKVLLKHCSPDWLPVLVLGAFSGIRPEELAPDNRDEKPGLVWENVLWDKRKVDVPAAVSKTRRRRFAPLPDAALAFLTPYRKAKGPIAPVNVRLSNYVRRLKAISRAEWKPDALRHSFASYRLALTKDMPALALEMGNSPAMIFKHYLDLRHEEEAEEWFAMRPAA